MHKRWFSKIKAKRSRLYETVYLIRYPISLNITKVNKETWYSGYKYIDLQALKYRSVTDIVQPIREIVRRNEETTEHSVRLK